MSAVRKKIEPIDPEDQVMMINEGIHPPYKVARDPKVWTKTDAEKKALKREKHRTKK